MLGNAEEGRWRWESQASGKGPALRTRAEGTLPLGCALTAALLSFPPGTTRPFTPNNHALHSKGCLIWVPRFSKLQRGHVLNGDPENTGGLPELLEVASVVFLLFCFVF